ncbi:TPA: hypothetical protein VPF48_000868 [Streptococcus pyogenes]|nr:hypothetical protein [Streptococcus pyogenes]
MLGPTRNNFANGRAREGRGDENSKRSTGTTYISSNTRGNGEQDDEAGARYAESHRKGTEDGYEAGKKATNETLERGNIQVPDKLDPEGYKDGYEGGFSKGFNEANHPILTAIGDFLSWLWGLFTGEFTGEQ